MLGTVILLGLFAIVQVRRSLVHSGRSRSAAGAVDFQKPFLMSRRRRSVSQYDRCLDRGKPASGN